MSENHEHQMPVDQQAEMPRREFIQKSLVASGGAFMGMAAGNKMVLPKLGNQRPRNAASSRRDKGNNGVGNGYDPQPPGNPPVNDGPGTGPGNPGNNMGGSLGGNRLRNIGK